MADASTASAIAERIAQRCEHATLHGDTWQACCPVHDDRNPSLSITPKGEKVLLHCHAGCTTEAVVAALGLRMEDLFSKDAAKRGNGHKTIVQVYDYFDASGTLVHQTVRYQPKAFKQRRPDPANSSEYLWSLKGIEPVLYHLPDVLAAVQRGETVYLCEGERDVDALMALGLVATCNAMGAGKWRDSYTETLRGADVVIVPDNDAPGRDHGELVAQSLNGIAHSVKVLALPNLPNKGDVSDWLQAGGTPPELETLAALAPLWTPTAVQKVRQRRNGQRHEAGGTLDSEQEQPQLDERIYGTAKPKPQHTDTLPYSDYTNALAFVRDHGQDLRYCYPWGKWLCWTATHWKTETDGAVMRAAKQTIKRLARHAEDLEDDSAVNALLKHVKASLATSKLKAMVESAQSEPSIPVQPEDLDKDPWLLNCLNGTLDLKTGTLQPHDRTDLLTRCIPVAFNKQAQCPTWDAFLARIMGGNQNLSSFLQRAVGYALTGVIREHVLLLLWGKGRNGKSTFVNALLKLLGAYGLKAPSELLMVSQTDRHPTEKALLHGKRFVATVETEQGRRLAEAFVKEATGGDPITARRMREDPWTFEATHKVFLATNHMPVIKGMDDAIWDRVKLIPFQVKFFSSEQEGEPKQDTTLPGKLQAELPGILAWAVRGCLAWQQDGLGEPDEVQQATAGYRNAMDVLGQFISECCLVGPSYRTKAADLYDAYKRWCEQNGEHADVQRTWGMALTEREYERKRGTGGAYWWLGIGLQHPTPPEKGTGVRSDDSEPLVNQVNDSEPRNGIDGLQISHVEQNRKLGSLGSLDSLSVDDTPADVGDDYDEGVI